MICPRCGATLSIGSREGIEIDYCTSCRGVWLDAGELDKIVERSRVHGADRGSARRHDDHDRESWWEKIIDIFD